MSKKLISIFMIFLTTLTAYPCSTMSYNDVSSHTWVTKSFDFGNPNGYFFINKKNVYKRSLTFSFGLGKTWTSLYGSITFNQIGRDFPYGGMNEHGLNMEIMWLDETKYPAPKYNQQINESQIIQYILDTAATTEEAIEKIKNVEITPVMAKVHYMVCDVSNECATIEYLNKELVIHKMNKGNERILQNSIYSDMLKNDIREKGKTLRNSEQDLKFIFDNSNLENEVEIVSKSFANLDKVYQPNWTRWQIVYNLNMKKVWFRTMQERNIKSLDLNDYELDCKQSLVEEVIDINSNASGPVKQMIPFSKEINSQMLNSFKEVPSWMRKAGEFYLLINHTCLRNNNSEL